MHNLFCLRGTLLLGCTLVAICVSLKIRYLNIDNTTTTYYNTKYISYVNFTTRRIRNRGLTMSAADLHFSSTYSFGDNVSVHFSFYKFENNRYTRGFVELHYTLCDIVDRNKIFGHVLKQGKLSGSCPYTAGDYHFYNMTVPIKQVPKSFPYTKVRLYINTTPTATKELLFQLYVDLEIKEADVNTKNKK